MSYRQIKAIVRKENRDLLISALSQAGVTGFNFYKVKGQGEMQLAEDAEASKSYCFEIFINTAQVDQVKKAIIASVQTGLEGDGLIAISTVEELIRIRDCEAKTFENSQA